MSYVLPYLWALSTRMWAMRSLFLDSRRYQNKVLILRPTIRLVAEMYFNKGPTKIG